MLQKLAKPFVWLYCWLWYGQDPERTPDAPAEEKDQGTDNHAIHLGAGVMRNDAGSKFDVEF